jgi:gliding motility-associated-like protein
MVKNYASYFFSLFLLVCLLGWGHSGYAQINGSACDGDTPKYLDIDLRGKPDSVWVTPVANKRDGRCCGSGRNGAVGCIEFRFWLDEDAYGINFSIPVGAEPGGALTYVINCEGDEQGVGDDICLKGGRQYTITFCKPGSNKNIYQIASLGKPKAGPPLVVTEGCFGTMLSTGFNPDKPIRWTSVSPGVPGEHDGYLLTPTKPTTVVRLTGAEPPASVVYKVSGYPKGVCGVELVEDYVTVYFYSDVMVEILPKNPIVCFGGSTTQITATGSGGGPPYTYRWFKDGALLSGVNSAAINVGVGTYRVEMKDITNCSVSYDEVTVTGYSIPTQANAGPDQVVCNVGDNTIVQLAGTVQSATGGTWVGGAGTFTPNRETLNATYRPTTTELNNGSVTLTLRTTNTQNTDCPAATDQVTINFARIPVLNAGPDQTVCANNAAVALAGTVTTNPYWNGAVVWSGGSGTFFPNNTTLNATYTPSAAELAAAQTANTTVTLTLTSTGTAPCQPVSDAMVITITPAPLVDAGTDQTVCSNNNGGRVTLNGRVTIGGVASTGRWFGAGTFSNENSLTSTYTPTAAEITAGVATLTLRSTTNGNCSPVEDQVVIRITPAPILNVGPAQTVCANNSQVQLNATLTNPQGIALAWTTSGNGTFTNTTTLNPTYTPGSADITAGNVTLTLTATGNNCAVEQKSLVVSITPAPVVTASDQTVCGNNARVTLNGSVRITLNGLETNGNGEWVGGSGTFSSRTNLNATYTPSAAEIAAGFAEFRLRSTSNGNCLPVEKTVRITITPAPVLSAGPDLTVCANNNVVTLQGSVTVGNGSTWQGTVRWEGGAGAFSSRTALTPTYRPSDAEITAGRVTLTLVSTNNGTCNEVRDEMVLFITPAPIVNAGPDQSVCKNNINIKLDGSLQHTTTGVWKGGAGTFTPNRNDLKASYTPTAEEINNNSVTLTLESISAGCNPVTDAMVITFTPEPTADAGPSRLICASNPTVTIAGRVTGAAGGTWTGGNGTFIPDRNSLEITYIPTQAEVNNRLVLLTLTTTGIGNCLPARHSVQIVITPAPIVNAGPDLESCINNPEITLAGSVTNTNEHGWQGGNGTFVPGRTALNAKYIATPEEVAAGSVRLILRGKNSACDWITDDVVIRYAPAPIADAGPDRTICANNARVELAGTVTRATGGTWSGGNGTFAPNANTLNAVYTPTAAEIEAGTFRLTLTTTGNGLCNAVSDEMVVTVTPSPTANAGLDQTVCANNANIRLNGAVTLASGGIWSGGAGTFTPNATTLNATYVPTDAERTAGSVRLILTTTGVGNCIQVRDEMVITITPAPVVNAGSHITICADNPKAQLAGTVTIATGGIWSGGLGTYSPSASALDAVYTPSAAEIQAGEVTLTLASVGAESCIVVTNSVKIIITPAPTVSAGSNQTLCGNATTVTLNGTVTHAQGGLWTTAGSGTFSPNASALNATYTPSAADIANKSVQLTLTTTGNGVCRPVSSTMLISFTDVPAINAGPDQTVCTNAFPIQLAGVGSAAVWSGGAGTFSPNNSTLNATYMPTAQEIAAGRITLRLTTVASGACPVIWDEMVITIPPAPIVNAGPDVIVCSDATVINLNGFVGNAGGGTWTSSGRGNFGNANSLATTYTLSNADRVAGNVITLTLTSTGNAFCPEVRDQLEIRITPAPTASAGGDQSICADAEGFQLNGSVTVASGGIWSGGAGTFVPGNSALNAFYIPTEAERLGGVAVQLTLTTTGNGDCNPASDVINLRITPAPTANAGPDQVICADAGRIDLEGIVTVAGGGFWRTNGNGTFSPNHTLLRTSYIPTAEDIARGSVTFTLVTEPNGTCRPVEDQVVVRITPTPVVNAGPEQTVCADTDGVQLAGTITLPATGAVWSTSGTGTFSDANALNAIYRPSALDISLGSVSLTLTTTTTTADGATCKPVKSIVNINITPRVTVYAGEDFTVCSDIDRVEIIATVTVATGFTWTVREGMGTVVLENNRYYYVPNAAAKTAGRATLELTSTGNGNCRQVQDLLEITLTPAPIVSAGPDQTICADATGYQLNGTATIGGATIAARWTTSGTGTFAPNADALNATYIPSSADKANGSVNITLTSTGNGTCKAVTDAMVLTITPAPIVNAGPDQTICADASAVQLNGSVQNAGGGIWTTSGKGTFSDATALNARYTPHADDILAGRVVLTLTTTDNLTCIPVSDNMEIIITPAPTVTVVPELIVCADAPSVTLSGAVTVATGGIWTSNGTGTFIPGADNLSPTYIFSAQDLENIPAAGKQISFTLTTTGNGTCNPVTAITVVTITPAPVINAGPDQSLCSDVTSVQLAGSVNVASGVRWSTSGTGTFSPGATSATALYIPSQADKDLGKVTLTIVSTGNGTCRPVEDQVEISFTPAPTANAGPDQTVCADTDGVYLTGIVSGATGGTWSTLSGEGRFEPGKDALSVIFIPSARQIQEGIARITLTTTGTDICAPASSRVTITITPIPVINAGQAQTICADAAGVQLNGVIANAPSGRWSTSGTGTFSDANLLNAFYTPSAADKLSGKVTLTLTATGNTLCKQYFRTVDVFITPAPTLALTFDDCMDEAGARLGAAVTTATGVLWSGGTGAFSSTTSLTPTYRPSAAEVQAGTVTLRATTTGNGSCNPVTEQITINIKRAPRIIPGPTQIVCANIEGIQLNGSVEVFNGNAWVASTGVWTSSGGGRFVPDATALNAVYIHSAADIVNGSVILTLTSDITPNVCRSYSRTVEMIITSPVPTANAGADLSMCADGDFVSLRGSVTIADGGRWFRFDGTTTGISNPASLSTNFTPTADDRTAGGVRLILETTGNGICNPARDTMTVHITPTPTITVPENDVICSTSESYFVSATFTVATDAVWSTSGTGTFENTLNPAIARYVFSAADKSNGSVTLRATTVGMEPCKPESASFTISFTPGPQVNAGASAVCADVPIVPLAGGKNMYTGPTRWRTTGDGHFEDSTALQTRYVREGRDLIAGAVVKLYLVNLPEANDVCEQVSDTITLDLKPLPVANAGADQAICADQGSIQVNGTVTNATGGTWATTGTGTFANPAALATTYTPSAEDRTAGTVKLFLTTISDCTPETDTLVLTITPQAVVSIQPETMCIEGEYVQMEGTVLNASSFVWTTSGTGTFSDNSLTPRYTPSAQDRANYSPSNPVRITLTAQGLDNCGPVSKTINLHLSPPPTAQINPVASVCANANTITLSAVSDGNQFMWSSSTNGLFTPNNALGVTYTLTEADRASTEITITFVALSTTSGCASSSQIVIPVTPAPTVSVAMETLCTEADVVNLSGIVTNASGSVWTVDTPAGQAGTFANAGALVTTYTLSAHEKANPGTPIRFTLSAIADCNTTPATVTLNQTPAPIVDAGPDVVICASSPSPVAQLRGTITNAPGGIWSGGEGTLANASDLNTTYTPSQAEIEKGKLGDYSVTLYLTSTGGVCSAVVDSMVVIIQQMPVAIARAGADRELCADNTNGINLAGVVERTKGGIWSTLGTGTFDNPSDLGATYFPSPADIANMYVRLVLTTVSGDGTTIYNCEEDSDTLTLFVRPVPTVRVPNAVICSDEPGVRLSGTVENATGGSWVSSGTGAFMPDRNRLNPIYVPSDADRAAGLVTLTLTTTGIGECNPATAEVQLNITPPPAISAGDDLEICEDATSVALNGTIISGASNVSGTWSIVPDMGSGTFSSNGLQAVYVPSAEDKTRKLVKLVLTTTGVGNCNPVTDTLDINILDPIIVAIADVLTVCVEDTEVQLTGSIDNATGAVWSGGTGTFSPNAFDLNARYNITQQDRINGNVELTLTTTGTGDCSEKFTTVEIKFTEIITLTLDEVMARCADQVVIPINASISPNGRQVVWRTTGTGTFDDSTQVVTNYRPSLEDKADSIIILSIRTTDTGNCLEEYAQTKLLLEPVPVVDAGFAAEVCAEGAIISLSGSAQRAVGTLWSAVPVNGTSGTFADATALQTTYIPTDAEKAAGRARLVLTANRADCNPVRDTVEVIITPAVEITVPSPTIEVCDDVDFAQLNATLANASEGVWTTSGEGYFSPSASTLNARYYFGGDDKQNGPIELTLTATGTGACYDEALEVKVTIIPAPTVVAGTNSTICEDITLITLEGTLLNNDHGATATWSTTGTASALNQPPGSLIATYQPTNADRIAGQVSFILQSSGPRSCNPVSDRITYFFEKVPTANAGQDQVVCADATSVQLNGSVTIVSGGTWSGGTGVFLPSPQALNATYVLSDEEKANPGTDIILTLISDEGSECSSVADQLRINITPRPTLSLIAPAVTCADGEYIPISAVFNTNVSSGIVWQASGSGDFAPSASATEAQYRMTDADKRAGQVSFTVRTQGSGTCNEISVTKTVIIAPAPRVTIDPVQPVCEDSESIILSAKRSAAHPAYNDLSSIWTSADPDGYFLPDPKDLLNVRYFPGAGDRAAGRAIITLTTENTGDYCQPGSVHEIIYFSPSPIADAGPDQSICADADGFTVSGRVEIATQGRWTTTGTGTFDNASLLQATYRPSVADRTAGTVQLILHTTVAPGDVCSSAADTMTLTITPAPYIVAGPATVCGDSKGVDMYAEVYHALGGRWSTSGSGRFAPNEYDLNARYIPSAADVAAGSVQVMLTTEGNGLCMPVTTEVTVFIAPLPVADAGPDQVICRNGSTTLLAKPLPDVSYEWFNSSGIMISTTAMVNVTVSENTFFILTVRDQKTCSTSDTVRVSVIDPPVLNLPEQYCFEPGMKIDASPTRMPSVNGSFQWYRNDTLLVQERTSEITIHQAGRYVVQYSYGGCTVYDTTLVNTPPVLAGVDREVCTGSTLTIRTTQVTGALYRWTHNGNPVGVNSDSLTVTVNANERYIVAVTNTAGCTSFDTIMVTVVPPPVFTLSNVPSCVGETVTLVGKPANITNDRATYTWYKEDVLLADTTSSITVRESGEYTVHFQLGECITTASSVVTFHALPVTDMVDKVTFCKEADIFTTIDAGPGYKYLWLASGDTTRTLEVSEPGMYHVQVFNENNCSVLDSIYVRNACRPRVFVPTAITPGKPGADSKLHVFGANYQNFKLTIFNRWGEIIFYTEDPNEAWDGTYRGEMMPVGVYAWTVYYEGNADEFVGPYQMQGSVTLIR